MFGQGNFDESGDSLVESVLKAGDLEGGVPCQSNFVAEAIIDRQVVSWTLKDTHVLEKEVNRHDDHG